MTPDALHEGRRLRLLYASVGGGIGTLLPYLVLYLTGRGLSPAAAGLVSGLMSGVGVGVIALWGRLADGRLGVVRALRWSFVLSALTALALLGAGSSPVAVVVCALLLAAARAPGEALSDALAVRTRTGAADYGRIRMWASAGFALTVGVGGLVLQRTGLWLVLPAYAATCVVAALGTRGMSAAASVTTGPAAPAADAPASAARLLPPRVLVLLAGVLVFGVAMATSFTVLPLRIVDVGGAVAVVGAASVVGALAEIPLMHRSSWLAAHMGGRPAVLLGGVMFAVALVGYGAVSDAWGLVAVSALRGGGYALVYVGLVVSVRRAFPADLQARGQALLQTVLMGVAPIAGASLGGLAYGRVAPVLLFGAAGVLALLGTALACSRWAGAAATPGRAVTQVGA
ncbi:MFS transporter [Microlunatus flavus]|uniref:MFS_1 like family protein n=1 Tax=Microlunatus flavus TaxID=1036181 RepID=A0A1H9MIR6_9ACTN|nr:MFS transporter [Microlunatus flavus]SER23033.1 MFS_1 like family protein [Microlunatus flavus]